MTQIAAATGVVRFCRNEAFSEYGQNCCDASNGWLEPRQLVRLGSDVRHRQRACLTRTFFTQFRRSGGCCFVGRGQRPLCTWRISSERRRTRRIRRQLRRSRAIQATKVRLSELYGARRDDALPTPSHSLSKMALEEIDAIHRLNKRAGRVAHRIDRQSSLVPDRSSLVLDCGSPSIESNDAIRITTVPPCPA